MNSRKRGKVIIPLSTKNKKASGNHSMVVDAIDADIQTMNCKAVRNRNAVYAFCRRTPTDKRIGMIAVHRFIMERMLGRPLDTKEQIDHIDMNRLNNSRKNLRLASHTENLRNQGMYSNNKVGLKGVYQTEYQKYRATIYVNKKKVHLGIYQIALDAHRAYCEAAVKYFGEFANFGQGSPFTPQMFMTQEKAA